MAVSWVSGADKNQSIDTIIGKAEIKIHEMIFFIYFTPLESLFLFLEEVNSLCGAPVFDFWWHILVFHNFTLKSMGSKWAIKYNQPVSKDSGISGVSLLNRKWNWNQHLNRKKSILTDSFLGIFDKSTR